MRNIMNVFNITKLHEGVSKSEWKICIIFQLHFPISEAPLTEISLRC